jgi:hypothetical protein
MVILFKKALVQHVGGEKEGFSAIGSDFFHHLLRLLSGVFPGKDGYAGAGPRKIPADGLSQNAAGSGNDHYFS